MTLVSTSCSVLPSSQEKIHWIDVRSSEEYSEKHFSQAANIPHKEIASRINEVTNDKNAIIYLYCRSGRRAEVAKEQLEQLGFTQVINKGGLVDVLQDN